MTAGALEIVDANDYYPFGMNHLKSGKAIFGQGSYKNYKYSGKELQETGMYDFGARMYMPDLGRWGVMDPLAEMMRRHSPYNYAYNNPVNFVDPDGMMPRRLTIAGEGGPLDYQQSPSYNPNWMGIGNNVGYGDSYGFGAVYSGGGGRASYAFTGNSASSMFSYFANGGNMNDISFNKGWAIWSTLDNSNNFMYNDYDSMLTGFTGGVTLHRAKVNNDTSWDAYKNWADWGSTAAGGGFSYLAKQRTTLYNNGYWIDNLGQVRSTGYAGRAADSQIGLRSTYLRNTRMFAKYSKTAGYIGYAINAGQIGYGVYEDGGKFGVRAKVATASVAGGLAGAAAGAWLGAKIFAPIGGAIGVAFFGVGAAPGTAIGAAIGGIIGSIVGGYYGGDYAEGLASDYLNKPDY